MATDNTMESLLARWLAVQPEAFYGVDFSTPLPAPETLGHGTKLDANPVPVDVYRVEHPASRCGPFMGEVRGQVMDSLPGCLVTLGGYRDGINKMSGMRGEYLFGTPSLETAAAWFKRCAAALDEHGYMLSRYRAIEVVVGRSGLQLAFDPRTAELIDRMPCALLQQVVEAPLDRARDITGGSW